MFFSVCWAKAQQERQRDLLVLCDGDFIRRASKTAVAFAAPIIVAVTAATSLMKTFAVFTQLLIDMNVRNTLFTVCKNIQ